MSTAYTYDAEREVMRYVGLTPQISRAVHEMRRQARAYSRIQERWCSEQMDEPTQRRLSAVEARKEQKILTLADTLPEPTDPVTGQRGRWAVMFEGDPRGTTVALIPMWDGEDDRVRRESSRWITLDHL